jgi:hypothetical protein
VGHQGVDLLEAHALLDGPLHAHRSGTAFQQLAHGPHAAVAEVIDVVDDPWVSRSSISDGRGRMSSLPGC